MAALALQAAGSPALSSQASPARGLTAVPGLKVGHHTLTERPTGCTVVLAEKGATAGVDVRGSAPGTRETDLLAPTASVEQVHAIMLGGGSAFGLDAATGVMRYLEQRGDRLQVRRRCRADRARRDSLRPRRRRSKDPADGRVRIPGGEGCHGRAGLRGERRCRRWRDGRQDGRPRPRDERRHRQRRHHAPERPRRRGDRRRQRARRRHRSCDRPGRRRHAHGRRQGAGGCAPPPQVRRARSAAPRSAAAHDDRRRRDQRDVDENAGDANRPNGPRRSRPRDRSRPYLGRRRRDLRARDRRAPGPADLDTIGALAADAMSEAILRAVRAATGIPGYPAARDLR